jgi:hypothetical protein
VTERREATWPEFERRLAATLESMRPETFLILTTLPDPGDRAVYVQFANATTLLRLEAVGNEYLPEARRLDEAAMARMAALGWQRPGEDEEQHNLFREWPLPAAWAEAASLAVVTLRDVFGLPGPSALVYQVGAFGEGEAAEVDLGIARQVRATEIRDRPRSRHQVPDLAALVEEGLKRWLGVTEVVRDEDGDYPVRVGSAVVFVRIVDGTPPMVVAFSPILRDVQPSAGLLIALNELNMRIRFGRVFWVANQVVVMTEVTGVDASADQIALVCLELGGLADALDDALSGRFGGQTTFATAPTLLN